MQNGTRFCSREICHRFPEHISILLPCWVHFVKSRSASCFYAFLKLIHIFSDTGDYGFLLPADQIMPQFDETIAGIIAPNKLPK